MGYYPPLPLIDALNETMLWHGTTVTLPKASLSIDWSTFERWDDTWLEAFGGLYVTAEWSEAWHAYAYRLATQINRRYEEPVVKPIVYQVILRPGVEIAIDEDEFGWSSFLATSEIRNLNVSKVVSKCLNQSGTLDAFEEQRSQALQEDLKQLEELQKELDAEGGEPEVAVIGDPDFLYYQELVDTWSNEFAEPVLQGWMSEVEARQDWLELLSIDEMEARRGLPKLRILNGNFDLREDATP